MGNNLSEILSSALMAHASATYDPQPQVAELISQAVEMQQDVQDAAAYSSSLEVLLATLHSESDVLLAENANPALDALLVLFHHIETLHQLVQDQKASALIAHYDSPSAFRDIQTRTPLVDACKSQSRIVFGHFQTLHEKAKNLTQEFTELASAFTFQTALAQERIESLENMMHVAETLRDGVERQRENWQSQKAVAETHVQQARETIRSAERKRDSMESARVVRNFLTFGIGEVFDFFDLNEEIEASERTVASAQRNAHACEQSIQRAVNALQCISEEVARLALLGDTVRDQEMTLQASVVHGQALRTRTIDLTNASLDVSLFVGRLAAKSETLATHYTAQEFARGVLNFGNLLVSEGRLDELLIQHDIEELQETLDVIAQSDSEHTLVWGDGSMGTQRPWVSIEDMM